MTCAQYVEVDSDARDNVVNNVTLSQTCNISQTSAAQDNSLIIGISIGVGVVIIVVIVVAAVISGQIKRTKLEKERKERQLKQQATNPQKESTPNTPKTQPSKKIKQNEVKKSKPNSGSWHKKK